MISPETKNEIDGLSDSIDLAIDCFVNNKFHEARDILTRLVDRGVDDAYLYLGQVYELEGDEINPLIDYEKAHFYYLKSIELTGTIEAHLSIAKMFRVGSFGSKDYKSALDIYFYLINEGLDADGYLFFIVGYMYMHGHGVDKGIDIAERYLRKGCNFGHIPSMTFLSSILFNKKSYLQSIIIKIRSIPFALYYGVFDKHNPKTRL